MKIKYLLCTSSLVFLWTMSLVCHKSFLPVQVPEPKGQKPEEITKFIASAEFSKIPEEQKNNYLGKITPPSPEKAAEMFAAAEKLSDEERKRLHENMRPVFEAAMKKRVDEYFALAPEKREEYLDREIEKMEAMRNANSKDGPGGRPPHPPKPSVDELKSRVEKTAPATQAKMHQFFMDMRKRMEKRGQNG